MSRLIYLIGASGAGKDTLLGYLKRHSGAPHRYVIAHRYITRSLTTDHENHICVSEREFRMRLEAGLFAMHWQSHGLLYGVGIEIETWLAAGLDVIINGSRAYLAQASERYPALLPIKLQVSSQILERRLSARGRETPAAVEQRLLRADAYDKVGPADMTVIDNDGPIEQTAAGFLAAVARHR